MGMLSKSLQVLFRKYFKNSNIEFERHNNILVLKRIRVISIATIFMSILFYLFDYITAMNGADKLYITTIVMLHTACVVASVLFLIINKKILNKKGLSRYGLHAVIASIYVFLYVFMGVLSSLNSQRYTGNIYSYVSLSLVAAVGFTLKPWIMLFTFGLNHVLLINGLAVFSKDFNTLSVKQLNATTMVGIAILFSYFFYKLRLNEYLVHKKLSESEENFRKLFYVNPFPVFIIRIRDGKIVKASAQALKIMQIEEKGLDKLESFNLHMKNTSSEFLEEIRSKNSIYNRIVKYELNGKSMWVTANYELIKYENEDCVLTGFMDITEIRKVEAELSQYAYTDVLTGVLNRRMGVKQVEELTQRDSLNSIEFVLCFLDMNELKSVNDTYGHGQGDNYIKTFCQVVNEEIGNKDIFFRMGGDEFIIVFLEKTLVETENIWEKIINRFYELSKEMGISISRAASHGLYHYKAGDDVTVEEMIELADKQMYEEKIMHKKELV